jgi:hypothetical protein
MVSVSVRLRQLEEIEKVHLVIEQIESVRGTCSNVH